MANETFDAKIKVTFFEKKLSQSKVVDWDLPAANSGWKIVQTMMIFNTSFPFWHLRSPKITMQLLERNFYFGQAFESK